MQEQTEERCPPHRYLGVHAICEHCKHQKGVGEALKPWTKVTLSTPYKCDSKGCRKEHGTMEVMYEWKEERRVGNEMLASAVYLCIDCHRVRIAGDVADRLCVICQDAPASEGKSTCGNAAGACAKALKRRNEKQAKENARQSEAG